jgi:hypothetical protein
LYIEGTSDGTKKVINVSNNHSSRIFQAGVRVKLVENGVIKAGKYTVKTMDIEYKSDIFYQKGLTKNAVEVVAKFSNSQEQIDDFISKNLLFISKNHGLRRDVSEEEIDKRKSITDLLVDGWGDNQDSEKDIK